MEEELRILTQNLWGLLWVSKHRRQRIEAFGDIISGRLSSRPSSLASNDDATLLTSKPVPSRTGCPWDIIVLQECWVYDDAMLLQAKAREGGLAHARFFFSGAIGSGLMILSRFPILASRILPYPLNGHPLHVIEGDFFGVHNNPPSLERLMKYARTAGKGVGSATIDLGYGRGLAEILVTHVRLSFQATTQIQRAQFFAPGGESPAHRLAQVWEVANLARSAADKGRHVFLCGDLNSMPDSLTMRFLMGHAQLCDSWAVVHPRPPGHSTPPTDMEAIQQHGVTCDSPLCSWTAGKHLGEYAKRNRGKRLDYILYRPSSLPNHEVAAVECQVAIIDLVPGQSYSISDHFAVEATFVFQQAAASLGIPKAQSLASSTYTEVLNMLSNSLARARYASRGHLQIFVGCVLLGVPGVAVAASFQPLQYLNWIFVLLGVAVGFVGTTMLYVGFVCGRLEEGALRNVIDEMESWRKGLAPA